MDLEGLLAERAIYQQLIRFARAMDERDWKAFDHLTTVDVEFDVGLGVQRGRQAFVDTMRRYLDACGTTQHLLGNVLIDVDGDAARSEAYVSDVHLGRGDDGSVLFRTLGNYSDTWKRVEGHWLICRRIKDNRASIGTMDVFGPESSRGEEE